MAVLVLTKDNFEQEVLNSDKPVLVDFWAQHCGICRVVAPIIDEIAEEVDSAKIGKVDVDAENELAIKYHIMSLPTLCVFKGGKIVKQAVGAKNKEGILALLT